MEGREAMSSGGVTVAAEQGGLKSESPNPNPNPKPSQSVGDIVKAPSTATGLVSMDPSMAFGPMKKKRGRPRKYGPDGSLVIPVKEREGSVVLALTPFSLSAPPGMAGNFSGKRGRGRPPGSSQRQKLETLGEWVAYSAGGNFTPHVIAIAAREDITMKIMSFSQQGPRAICVLAANGVVSSVTLRQPDSSGGTLTYEGRFEILSLSGSFMLTESGGTRSRSGGLSVSLASPDGRVIGGGVAGQLVAASPVQVVVGSFMPNNQEQMKQPKSEGFPHMANTAATAAIPISTAEMDDVYGTPGQQTPTPLKANHTASSSFRAERWATSQSLPESKSSTDINISLPGG